MFCVAESAISPSRWLFSAVSVEFSSGMISDSALPVSVTLPVASVAEFKRWMVPRWLTEVVETRMPSCVTAWPASVMSPCCEKISPVLPTVPLVLPA